jgi:hypothetical protein
MKDTNIIRVAITRRGAAYKKAGRWTEHVAGQDAEPRKYRRGMM